MSEGDKDSRTLPPTPRRREEAQRKDQIPKSRDVNTVAVIVAVLVVGIWAVPAFLARHRDEVGLWLGSVDTLEVTPETVGTILGRVAHGVFVSVWPVMAAAVVAGSAAQVFQTGLRFRLERVQPKFSALNPQRELKKMLSTEGLMSIGKAAVKLAFVGYVAYRVVLKAGAGAEELVALSVADILDFIGSGIVRTVAWVALALVLLAAIDYAYERHRVEKSLKMSRQEMKDELRATEGDLQIKRRFRKFHTELTKNKMLAEVPMADVVLTNPVHVAVALRYDAEAMGAPHIVAKGAGEVAQQIKEIARKAGVPIVERRALARLLFRSVKVGQEIPAALYRAVAEILAYIYAIRRSPAAQTAARGT